MKKDLKKSSEKSIIKSIEEKKVDEKELIRIRKRAEINEKKLKRKKVLINAIKYLSLNNISVNEYVSTKIFPTKPFFFTSTIMMPSPSSSI